MFERLKSFFVKKSPTISSDYVAYENGSNKEYDTLYDDYVNSVEALDTVIRTAASIASMATINVYKEDAKGNRKPLKIKNIDLQYDINESDSQNDFIRKVFSSILTQGASIILAEQGPSKNINFYPYNPAKFNLSATENSIVSEFIYLAEDGSEMSFQPKDVIYVNNSIDLSNLAYSTSRLKPLNDMLLVQAGLMNNQKEFYQSGSKDSVIISPKEPISAEKIRAIQAAFTTFIQSNRTQALFLNADIDVKSVSNAQSPKEIMEALLVINQQVLQSFGMPEYLLGNYKGYVSDAAVITASQIFFQIQLRPIFKSIAHQMTKYFRTTLKLQQAIVDFNFDDIDIIHDSLETKLSFVEKGYKLGLLSINEARSILEIEPLDTEEANLHFLPSYLVSSTPIPIEQYAEIAPTLFAQATDAGDANADTAGMNEDGTGSGSTGGEDNAPNDANT